MTPEEAFALGQEFADLRKQLSQALTDVAEMQAIAAERSEACERAEAERDRLRERLTASTRISLAKGDEITRLNGYLAAATATCQQQEAAIQRVRAMHQPDPATLEAEDGYNDRCTCGDSLPCPTITALDQPEQSGTTSNDVEQGLPYCERHDAWHVATCEEWQAALDAREGT